MGFVNSSLPPVPEDRETRAKNQARNEEEKQLKDEAKAKTAKKAKAVEDLAKHCREARKAGLPELEIPEASISEGGDLEDSHWLNELLEEEESPARGWSEAPGGGP